MPGKLRRLSTREVIRVLEGFGFAPVPGGKGSHVKLRRDTSGGRQTLIIPQADPLDRGTIRAIVRQAGRYVPEESLRPHFFEA